MILLHPDYPNNSMKKTIGLFYKLLDYFSKIFKTDLRYIFQGGSLLTLTQITSAIFGFLMTIAFANYLDQELFGVYKYILATYALLALCSLPGIDTSLIDTISKGNTQAFKSAIFIKLRWGILGSLASFTYAAYNYFTGETMLGNIFIIIGIFLPFLESLSIYSAYYNGTKKYLQWTITEILNQAFSTLALFSAIYFTHNIYILVLTYFLSYIFIRLLITIYILKTGDFQKLENENIGDYLAYGKTMSWYQIVTRAINTLDSVILFNIVGPVSLAVFSIANAIPTRAQSIVRISGTLAFPKFSNKSEKEILETLPKKMFLFGILLFLGAAFYAAISPLLFKILFPKYLDAVPYTQALMFFIVSGMTYPYGAYMIVFKKIREQYEMAFINITTKAVCLITFVPLFGVWGAIIGVLVSSYSTIFAVYYYIWRDRKKLAN